MSKTGQIRQVWVKHFQNKEKSFQHFIVIFIQFLKKIYGEKQEGR